MDPSRYYRSHTVNLSSSQIAKKALEDVMCQKIWLNGHLLSDSYSVLKHLSFCLGMEFVW